MEINFLEEKGAASHLDVGLFLALVHFCFSFAPLPLSGFCCDSVTVLSGAIRRRGRSLCSSCVNPIVTSPLWSKGDWVLCVHMFVSEMFMDYWEVTLCSWASSEQGTRHWCGDCCTWLCIHKPRRLLSLQCGSCISTKSQNEIWSADLLKLFLLNK